MKLFYRIIPNYLNLKKTTFFLFKKVLTVIQRLIKDFPLSKQSLYEMLGSNSPYHEQQKKVQFIFQRMDENQDGKISLEEFIDVCTQDTQLAKLLCSGTGVMPDEE